MDTEMLIVSRELIATILAPYSKQLQIELQHYDNGLALLRLTVREGRRFTQIDFDAETAAQLAEHLSVFANR
ncbi:MAG: hypothetical protein KGQ42_05160 [Alphaproteobacteria bacterium]|nr:hypothetical protein [Alphaproteobacteria bacterium]